MRLVMVDEARVLRVYLRLVLDPQPREPEPQHGAAAVEGGELIVGFVQ